MKTEIFLDIENTVIDDLSSCQLMHENCNKISKYIKNNFGFTNDVKVNLFTWGWKEQNEIKQYIVDWIFNVLEVPVENRGIVWTKDDSIDCLFKKKIVNTTDELELEDLHIPGAMKRFGMEKQTCFIHQCKDLNFPCSCVLIDDLIEEKETRLFNDRNLIIHFLNPSKL